VLTQASIEALKMHFDCSELNGDESVYASRNGEDDIAFVAIASNGNITTYKNDSYPDELLDEEIMILCCTKYSDNSVYIPAEFNSDKYIAEAFDYSRGIIIELIVAAITFVLCAIFLVIYWLLFQDSEKLIIIGAIICLPVIFFIISVFKARWKASGDK
jgi:uncharacterized membrane protein